ncbi:hypothetical protein FHS29_001037 [Saccharothrix tamanrassetensis]|uniref:Uncharacterized protein n=1 Tax=Saccharothrix tamanrassetensis TaxID=1051531 RepID=A0A841CE93_9PSEU|nr:hypothetical protein [Saccharothrix tamanrassetensis]MBB5954467.1 hypothetical protein [Saccharothrix tamanrassetensis]
MIGLASWVTEATPAVISVTAVAGLRFLLLLLVILPLIWSGKPARRRAAADALRILTRRRPRGDDRSSPDQGS